MLSVRIVGFSHTERQGCGTRQTLPLACLTTGPACGLVYLTTVPPVHPRVRAACGVYFHILSTMVTLMTGLAPTACSETASSATPFSSVLLFFSSFRYVSYVPALISSNLLGCSHRQPSPLSAEFYSPFAPSRR